MRLSRGLAELDESSRAASRLRPGHREGYALAFANLYREFGHAVMARAIGEPHEQFLELLPGVEDGIATLSLIEAAERSHELGGELVEV